MEKTDFRSRGRAIQEALRTQAVCLVRQVGKTQAEAAEAVGVSRQVVNRWLKRHAEGGEEALLDGRRVSPRKRKMSSASNAKSDAASANTGASLARRTLFRKPIAPARRSLSGANHGARKSGMGAPLKRKTARRRP
jgi:transposase-like protein